MKRVLLILMALLQITFCNAKDDGERTSPSLNTEIVRKCSYLDIEGVKYYDVIVTLKSKKRVGWSSDMYSVKVLVKDQKGKKLYKKTIKNSYLYIFSDGQIQVGTPKFNKIMIVKSIVGSWHGEIREKEGIW